MSQGRLRSAGILAALQLSYFVSLLLFGRFIGGDEIAYKAAGREWARSGAYVAPEMLGYPAWQDPAHPYELRRGVGPPLYPLAFGLFVKVFGFHPSSNVAFDGLIHILLGWATWSLARALGPDLPYEVAMVGAAATLPLGNTGRPDELGALLAMFGSAILLRRVSALRGAAAGLLFGLSAGTSLVAGGILLVWPVRAAWQQRRAGWLSIGSFAVSAAFVFSVAMTPLLLTTPYGIGLLLHGAQSSVHTTFRYAIENSLRYGKGHYLAACAALLVAVAHAMQSLRERSWGRWLGLWLPPLVALGALIIFLPVKYYYVWMVDPSLFAAATCAMTMLPWRAATRAVLVATAILFWGAASARFALMSLIGATLPPDQRMAENVAVIRHLIPAGSGVMTYDFWPAFAGSEYRTFSTEAEPRWSDVDYIVLTGNGSGSPGQAQSLLPERQAYVREHYTAIYDHLNRQPFHFGPIRTHSAWGYGPLILRRNDLAH
jgi:hypothetical protein